MRFQVLGSFLSMMLLLGCQAARTRAPEPARDRVELPSPSQSRSLVAQDAPLAGTSAEARASLHHVPSKPSLLSLLTLSAAVLGTVTTARPGSCTSSACLATRIALQTVALNERATASYAPESAPQPRTTRR